MSEAGSFVIAALAVVSLIVALIVYSYIRSMRAPLNRLHKSVNKRHDDLKDAADATSVIVTSLIAFIKAHEVFMNTEEGSDLYRMADVSMTAAMHALPTDVLAELRTALKRADEMLVEEDMRGGKNAGQD